MQRWRGLLETTEKDAEGKTKLKGLAVPKLYQEQKKSPSIFSLNPSALFRQNPREKTLTEEVTECRTLLTKWRKDFFQTLLELPDGFTDKHHLFGEKKNQWGQQFLETYRRLDENLNTVKKKDDLLIWNHLLLAQATVCMQNMAKEFDEYAKTLQDRAEKDGDALSMDVLAQALLGKKSYAEMIQNEALDPEQGMEMLYGALLEATLDDAFAHVYETVANKEEETQEKIVTDLIANGMQIFTKHSRALRTGEGKEELLSPIGSEEKKKLVEQSLALAGFRTPADLARVGLNVEKMQKQFWDLATKDFGIALFDGLLERAVEPETIDAIVLAVLETLQDGTPPPPSGMESKEDNELNEACGSFVLEFMENIHLPPGTKFVLKRKRIQRYTKRQLGRAVRQAISEKFLVKNIDGLMATLSEGIQKNGPITAQDKAKERRSSNRI